MAHTPVHREKERILRWLQQNAAQKPADPPLTAAQQAAIDKLKETPPDVSPDKDAPGDVPKVVVRPITMPDVDRLLIEMTQKLMSEGVIQGSLDQNGRVMGFQTEQAMDILALLFLGGGLPKEFVTLDLLDSNLLDAAASTVEEFRDIAQKFPQTPTMSRQRIEYMAAVKQAYISNGLVDPEFWNEAFGNTPTQEQTKFALSVHAGFQDARNDLLLDTAKVQTITDVSSRFLVVIDENDIQPRLSGERRDFGSFYAILPEEDTEEERTQLNVQAFTEERIQSFIKDPAQYLVDSIGLNANEIDDKDQKDVFELLLATAKREITSLVTNLRFKDASDQEIISEIQKYTQTFVDGFPDMFKDRITPIIGNKAAEDRQTAFEKVDSFSEIEALIIERALEEEYEILKGSDTAKALVNHILKSEGFKTFDPASGDPVPDVSGAIESFFSFGQAEFLATQEAEAEARLEQFEETDTFAEIEALVENTAAFVADFDDEPISDKAVKTIARRIVQEMQDAAVAGEPLPNAQALINEFFESGEAQQITFGEVAAKEREAAFEASDTFDEIAAQVKNVADFAGLDISPGAMRTIVRRIAQSMNEAQAIGAPLPNVGAMINEFFEPDPNGWSEARKLTFADDADEARREGEARDITEPSMGKAFRFAEASGLITSTSSPEFQQHIQEVFTGPAANALDIARTGDPNIDTNAFLQDFLNELQTDPSVDLTEQRLRERGFQQTDVPYGRIPTITGGLVGEPTPVTVDPTALRPAILEQLGADASPGFLNFLFRNEPELLAEFQQTQQPSIDQALFDKRTRAFSGGVGYPVPFGRDPLMEPSTRISKPTLPLTTEQTRQLALAGSYVTPPTAGAFLGSRIPGLRQEFRESPGGIAEARSEEQRITREAETARLRAEQEVEQSQSRALRRGGRTVFSRIRG
jgi:hypothetical protein